MKKSDLNNKLGQWETLSDDDKCRVLNELYDADGKLETKDLPTWLAEQVVITEATMGTMLHGAVIHKFNTKAPRFGYLYFLMKERRIVYIGATFDLRGRVAEHRRNYASEFDSVHFAKVRKDRLFVAEASAINKIRPPLNVKMIKGYSRNRIK